MNNLAIVLKKKRDDEARLARTSPQTVFNDDGTDQSWGGGSSYTLPQATETALGGIIAAEKTTESAEVKIDTATGKLYAPAAGEAANGVAPGGTAGQVYAKIDGTDYNAEWIDAPTTGAGIDYYALFCDGTTLSGRSETGACVLFKALAALPCKGGSFYTVWTTDVVFTCKLWDAAKNVLTSKQFTGDGTTARKSILFDTPYDLTPLTDYYMSIEQPSGSLPKYYGEALATAFVTPIQSYSGLPDGPLNSAGYVYNIGIILSV